MKVRKAVIPVAGFGTRFLPYTKSSPKEMLPIVDTPTLQLLIEELSESGIEQVLLITGRNKHSIEDHFDDNIELFDNLKENGNIELLEKMKKISKLCEISYIRQKEMKGLGHAILKAKNFVQDEPFAMMLGDELVFNKRTSAIKQVIDKFNQTNASIIGCKKVGRKDVDKYGIVEGKKLSDDLYKVIDMEEKPSIESAKSDIAILGRHVLKPEIFSYLENTKPGKNNEIQLTDAMRDYAKDLDMYAFIFEGKRYDTGNKFGYMQAVVEYALRDSEIGEEFKDYLKKLYFKL